MADEVALPKKKKDPLLVSLAATVRKRRYSLFLKQEGLAEKANCHVNYIGGIERAERNPSFTFLIDLANALECSPGDLFPKK